MSQFLEAFTNVSKVFLPKFVYIHSLQPDVIMYISYNCLQNSSAIFYDYVYLDYSWFIVITSRLAKLFFARCKINDLACEYTILQALFQKDMHIPRNQFFKFSCVIVWKFQIYLSF